MATKEDDLHRTDIPREDGKREEEEDDDGTDEEEDAPLPVYTLADILKRHQTAVPPYQVGACIGVTEEWDFASSDSPMSQWVGLLDAFPKVADPNTVWSWVTLAQRTIQAGTQTTTERTLYVLVHTQQSKPRLLVYHFASTLSNAFTSAEVTLPLSGTLPRQATSFPQKAWDACSAICLALLQAYHRANARFTTLDIALHYLPLMKATTAPSYYLVNLFTYLLGGKDFANKMRMGKVFDASKDLGQRFCRPFTEWFAPGSTGIQYDPSWRAFYNGAQTFIVPEAAEDDDEAIPVSNYLFSPAHLQRGIPASQNRDRDFPELFLLIEHWRAETKAISPHKVLPANDELIAVFAQLWSDLHTKISVLAGEIKASLGNPSSPGVASPTKRGAVNTDPTKAYIEKLDAPSSTETLLAKAKGLIEAIQSLSQKATLKNDSFWQKFIGLSAEEKESAETTAQGISLLIFQLEFNKLSFADQLQLVLSTTLNPFDLHQVRQFFLACQLLADQLLEQAKQHNLKFSELMGELHKISAALTEAEAALAKAKNTVAPEATDGAPGPLAAIAGELLTLHRDANHADSKYHPQQGFHTAAAQILSQLARRASAAASALAAAGSAADAAPADPTASGTDEAPKPNVDTALSVILNRLPLRGDDNSQAIETLRSQIQDSQTIVKAMLVVEEHIHRRMALKDQIERAGEAAPDFPQWQQWHNTFRTLEFSMREAPPAASSAASGTLSIKVESGTQKSTVTRCNIYEYVKKGEWLGFIGLLREQAYRLQENAQQTAIKQAITLSATTGNPRVRFSLLFSHRCDHMTPPPAGESQAMLGRLDRMRSIWTEYLEPLSEDINVITTGIPAADKRLPEAWATRIDAKWAWVVTAYQAQRVPSRPCVSCCLLICGHEADFDQLYRRPTTLRVNLPPRPGYSMPEVSIIFGEVQQSAGSDSDTSSGAFEYQKPLCESYSHIVIALAQVLAATKRLGSGQTIFEVPVHFMKAPDPQDFRDKLSFALQEQINPTQDGHLPNSEAWANTWGRFRRILQARCAFSIQQR